MNARRAALDRRGSGVAFVGSKSAAKNAMKNRQSFSKLRLWQIRLRQRIARQTRIGGPRRSRMSATPIHGLRAMWSLRKSSVSMRALIPVSGVRSPP